MKAIASIIEALYRGRQLASVETWKVKATALAAVSGLLSALLGIAVAMGWLDDIPPQTVMEVSSALVTIVSSVLAYLQVATTKKIGLPAPPHPDNAGLRSDELRPWDKAEHRDHRGLFGE